MQVKAIREGYHNHRYRKVGEVFNLEPIDGLDVKGNPKKFSAEQQFSERWMERLDGSAPAKSKAAPKKVQKAEAVEEVI